MNHTEQRERYRRILAGDTCINPASVFDPISARFADTLGFEVGMLAGSIASATVLGAPDLIVLTLTEFAEQVRRITRASDLSLMVDADHGYGNALNAMRTVEEMEAAGVSALSLEDTTLPIAFRQQPGQEMIPVEEMVGKLKAALAARKDPSLVIIGRTSAMAFAGVESATERVKAYTAVGVDAIFLAGVREREQLLAIRECTTLPLLLGNTPPAINDPDFLAANGVRIALTGHLPFLASVKATYDALRHLKDGGTPAALRENVATDELLDLATDQPEYARWQKEYLG
ncbi:MAG: isocitrate lyase/phosphoenolpyruvate mutase family protein [Dehalococcoidia bacterium]